MLMSFFLEVLVWFLVKVVFVIVVRCGECFVEVKELEDKGIIS